MKRLIGMTCIVVGVLLAIVTFGQSLFSLDFGRGKNDAGDVQEHALENIDRLDIDVSSSHVYVTSADIDHLRLELKKADDSRKTMHTQEQGDELQISVQGPKFQILPLDWLTQLISGKMPQTEELYVTIPDDFDQAIRLDSSSGTINMAGLQGLSELDIDVSSGSVMIEEIMTEKFRYDGSSGRLTVQGLNAHESEIAISSGKVILNDISGEIQGESSSGSVEINVASLEESIEWQASSGSITLRLPHEASFELSASTSSGSIDSDFPMMVQSQSKRELNGVVGEGGVPIDLKVSSGKIKIEQNNR
mgnify:FL=1